MAEAEANRGSLLQICVCVKVHLGQSWGIVLEQAVDACPAILLFTSLYKILNHSSSVLTLQRPLG